MQQDKKELEKFIKAFVLKTPQVIIQSRMGEKIHTSGVCSTVSNSSNWVSDSVEWGKVVNALVVYFTVASYQDYQRH